MSGSLFCRRANGGQIFERHPAVGRADDLDRNIEEGTPRPVQNAGDRGSREPGLAGKGCGLDPLSGKVI